jgi:hypothetical protein
MTMTMTPRITGVDSAPDRPCAKNCASGGGDFGDDADEDDQRDAVADTACGDLLAQPHQEHRAADQRDDAGCHEESPGVMRQTASLQRHRDAVGLEQGQRHGAIAGVLVQLLAALLAFLASGAARARTSCPEAAR